MGFDDKKRKHANGLGQCALFCELTSLIQGGNFPVIVRRELRSKTLEFVGKNATACLSIDAFCQIPCIFPC